jgi:hypothetical protein
MDWDQTTSLTSNLERFCLNLVPYLFIIQKMAISILGMVTNFYQIGPCRFPTRVTLQTSLIDALVFIISTLTNGALL